MNKPYVPHIVELCGSVSTGKTAVANGLKVLTEDRKDIRVVDDPARALLEKLGRSVDTLTKTEHANMQELIFEQMVREICQAEQDQVTLVMDSGLITNLVYSERCVDQEFFRQQFNVTRAFVKKMMYEVFYTPPYFDYEQDGIRQRNPSDQIQIDRDAQNMIERVEAPVYTMSNGSKESRALAAYDRIFLPVRS